MNGHNPLVIRLMMKKGEEVPDGAKIVWYCTECGCGYEKCCPMGKEIGWVQDGL